MQSRVGLRLRRLVGGADRRWGFAGLAGLVAVVLVVAGLSVANFDETEYRAQMSDAASVRTGVEVRVAGITVGKVTAVDLRSDHVDIRFTAKSEVFVGAESTLAVRMLTVVGGYYLALEPAGTTPLGTNPIPAERVLLPYNLPRLFQDAVTPLDEIEGGTLQQTFAEIKRTSSNSSGAIRSVVEAADSVVGILDEQNADISRTLAMAEEYMGAINGARGVIKELIDSWNLLEDSAERNLVQVGKTLGTVATLLSRLSPLGRQWDAKLGPALSALTASMPPLQDLANTLGQFTEAVTTLGKQLRPLAGQDATPTICVPSAERAC